MRNASSGPSRTYPKYHKISQILKFSPVKVSKIFRSETRKKKSQLPGRSPVNALSRHSSTSEVLENVPK